MKSALSELRRRLRNAVYHATGKRVRDLPMTLDKLMQSKGLNNERLSCGT